MAGDWRLMHLGSRGSGAGVEFGCSSLEDWTKSQLAGGGAWSGSIVERQQVSFISGREGSMREKGRERGIWSPSSVLAG